MNDPELDRRLENCRALLNAWQKFHAYLEAAAKQHPFTQKDESNFLKLKSQIAILHDSLLESLVEPTREMSATAQSVINVVEQCILLRQVSRMSAPEIKRMQIDWHESYLLLNETIGILEDRQASLAEIPLSKYKMDRFKKRVVMETKAVLSNKWLHIGLGVAAVFVALVVLPMIGVYSYDMLDEGPTRKFYRGIRNVVRDKFNGSMPFKDWEEYTTNLKPNIGMQTDNINNAQKDTIRKTLLVRSSYPNIPKLDLTQHTGKAIKMDVEVYKDRNARIAVLYMLFKHNTEANEFIDEYEAWQNKIPTNTTAANQEANTIGYGVYNNLAFIVGSNEPRPNKVKEIVDKLVEGRVEE